MASLALSTALMRLPKRAETADPQLLTATFVDAGPLLTLLSSPDHQILYGRRGTGKTHALMYLSESVRARGEAAIYVDMRVLGSTGGLYADPNLTVRERGTRLLVDVINELHDALQSYALGKETQQLIGDASVLALLEELSDAAAAVRVVGTVEHEERHTGTRSTEESAGFALGVTAGNPNLGVNAQDKTGASVQVEKRARETGVPHHHVHFGAVSRVLRDIVKKLPCARVWLLLDEWSAVPLDLQPLLADFLRRALLPTHGVTVKIAAIEHRSRFRVPTDAGDYLGIEVGADMAADVDFDDFMVFGNDAERAKSFFKELLYRHVHAVYARENALAEAPRTADDLVARAFTQKTAFDEFVRAAEGVPRDAINIVSLAVQRSSGGRISVNHVRSAARTWYQRDKENAIADENARALLHWIIDEVIAKRHARACLVQQGPAGTSHRIIGALVDARLLHVIKKGVSAKDQPGTRFDVYALDYGCYVELVSTAKEPKGLFSAGAEESAQFVEVPEDDYRSVRNAVLDLAAFLNRKTPSVRPQLSL